MIKNLLGDDDEASSRESTDNPKPRKTRDPAVIGLFGSDDDMNRPAESPRDEPFTLSTARPESLAETTRRSGLAWSMGVVFVVSVVFLLVLGWGADLLFGTSPWGMVAGIVVGSLIGFYQLFRISSQMFKN